MLTAAGLACSPTTAYRHLSAIAEKTGYLKVKGPDGEKGSTSTGRVCCAASGNRP